MSEPTAPNQNGASALLDPEAVELADLALALEDHAMDHSWWVHRTGAVTLHFDHSPPEIGDAIYVLPMPSEIGYTDMEDFVGLVRDPRAHHVLKRAIVGRGAFRRFKDSLLDYPDLREAWFAFHDARGERRAIEWLESHGLVGGEAAKDAIARRPEPTPSDLPGLLDGRGVAHHVARDLGRLYRERLIRVLLTGEWVRPGAHPDSPIEVVVVLDSVPDPWVEADRMERTLWRYSRRHDTVVTAMAVTTGELERATSLALTRAEPLR